MTEKGVVFGAGFLGTRIADSLSYKLVGRADINPLNFSELQDFLDREQPDLVINAIGKTGRPNIDWCETHREETFLSNVSAAINLSTACSERKIYFVHLGSGCIYDGDNGGKGFSEEDAPNFYGPQFYAKTKILAETALREFPGLLLRIRMPIDDRPHPRNLIDKLGGYEKLISAPNSMTTVPHMIVALGSLIANRREGIYNLVNPGVISAAEIMSLYQEIVDPSHEFGLMNLEELDNITQGKRSNCYLRTDKLLKSEGIAVTPPPIREGVIDCLTRYKEYLGGKK